MWNGRKVFTAEHGIGSEQTVRGGGEDGRKSAKVGGMGWEASGKMGKKRGGTGAVNMAAVREMLEQKNQSTMIEVRPRTAAPLFSICRGEAVELESRGGKEVESSE